MRNNTYLRPHYLDASAIVKLVIDEEYSDRLKKYIYEPDRSWRVCTSFCYAEAFGALKLKHKRNELTEKGYLVGSRRLVNLVRNRDLEMLEGNFCSPEAFIDAERMVDTYGIDFLDAFQLISSKESWSDLGLESKPLLVTADKDLAKAADREGVNFWYIRETREPTC